LIQITRLLAKQLVAVIKKALNRTKPTPVLTVRSGEEGVFVEAQAPNHAVRFHDPRSQDLDLMLIPLTVLEDVQGTKPEPVFLTRPRNGVLAASWDDKGVCREMEYDELEAVPDGPAFPELPAQFTENPAELLTALRNAYETTDVGSVRYALNCIQLRPDGVIAATDGRQLLRQSGFTFDFGEELLIQNTKYFSCKELPVDQPVRVGVIQSDKGASEAVFQTGPWTYWLGVQKEGRFPNVDQIIPPTHYAKCTLQLNPHDAKFLVDNLHRLPEGTTHRELTLDLNGSVVLRAASTSTPRPAEMILRNSSKQGDDVRICTDRNFLARAAAMGFTEFFLPNDASPALAVDANRTYLWMLLDQKEAIKPTDASLRIESPFNTRAYMPPATTTRKVTPVNRIASTPSAPITQPPVTQPPVAPAPAAVGEQVIRRRRRTSSNGKATTSLEQAISLRDQLRTALSGSKELIRTIKTEKRSQKSLKLALASLKQLQAVA
jgi:hypothetical protein